MSYPVKRSTSIDLDINSNGRLASLTCLPPAISSDRSISSRSVDKDGKEIYCAQFKSEAHGVIGEGYETCIVNRSKLFSRNKDGERSGTTTLAGKKRLAMMMAQLRDCSKMQDQPHELASFIFQNAGLIAGGRIKDALSLMFSMYIDKFVPTVMDVDIDQDAGNKYPPTVGVTTVGSPMVDDAVFMSIPFYAKGQNFTPFTLLSEVAEPYGNGATILVGDKGDLHFFNAQHERIDSKIDKTYVWNNIGNILNAYFARPSEFAATVVARANSLETPGEGVPQKDTLEKQVKFSEVFLNKPGLQTYKDYAF